MKLKTIRSNRPDRAHIMQEARDLTLQAMQTRAIAQHEKMPQSLRSALTHLADYLDGNTAPDPGGDSFGIMPPPRWDLGHAAHLLRTAVAELSQPTQPHPPGEQEQTHPDIVEALTDQLMRLSVRAAWTGTQKGARKTLDRLARGELNL